MPRLGKLALGFALVVFLGALSICIGYEAAEIARWIGGIHVQVGFQTPG